MSPRVLRSAVRLTGAALAVAALALPAAAEQTRSFDKTFPLAQGASLRLANLAGRIELANGPGSEVKVVATVHAEGATEAETRELLASLAWVERRDPDGKAFWALSYPVERFDRFHYPQSGSNGWGDHSTTTYLGRKVTVTSKPGAPRLFADLTITFPRQGDLAVRNAVGRVHGGELAGGLSVDTGSGDVELAAFAGGLSVDTGSGDVTVGRVSGQTDVDTGSGDVKVGLTGGVEGTRVSIDTGSGDVAVGAGHLAELDVDTGSGEIAVGVLDAERIALDTGSGDVIVRSPLTRTTVLRVDTGSGDVSIWAAADASFRVSADQGSGELDVRYADARLIRDGREVVGAERGDGRTRIDVDTGSGDCIVAPAGA